MIRFDHTERNGAFTLSVHTWYEPIERVTNEAERLGVPLVSPIMGQLNDLHDLNFDNNKWWKDAKTEKPTE